MASYSLFASFWFCAYADGCLTTAREGWAWWDIHIVH